MYFGRGAHDASASAENQQRLATFAGATAISSNAYFGRSDEDDEDDRDLYPLDRGDGMMGLGENETIQGLERGVRDMAGRVMANPEVQAVGEQLRAGVLKVSVGVCWVLQIGYWVLGRFAD